MDAKATPTDASSKQAKKKDPSLENDVSDFLEDDPCWGSRSFCSLEHLLGLVHRSTAILEETDAYLVLNKPPDLRMDGNYRATVHKLLTYWFPPASLIKTTTTTNTTLLQAVMRVHKHSHLADNNLRPCHQLDYATSGCLVVAKHAKAARRAGASLEQRGSVLKRYLAVVHGHLVVKRNEWPTLQASTCHAVFAQQERSYRRGRAKKRNDTFVGFLPSHAVFDQWKQQQLRQKRPTTTTACGNHKKQKQWHNPTNTSRNKEPLAVNADLVSEDDQAQLLHLKWSQVKQNLSWKRAFETMADQHNDRLRREQENIQQEQEQSIMSDRSSSMLPRLFCIRPEQEDSTDEDNVFYMCAPIAQVQEFAMRLAPPANKTIDDTDLTKYDFKPSLTRCQILHCGFLQIMDDNNRIPVTKVRLELKTGRRHQLRIHLAQVAGHVIVGDATYKGQQSATSLGGNGPQPDSAKNDLNNNNSMTSRMCLHAHQVCLPPLFSHVVTAPDPFPVDPKTGEVHVQDFCQTQRQFQEIHS